MCTSLRKAMSSTRRGSDSFPGRVTESGSRDFNWFTF
jgi:hypothetical protein